MTKIAIFNNYLDALLYSEKIHEYLKGNRPDYNANKWAEPVASPDGLTWNVKMPIEELEQKWETPIDTSVEKSKSVGITEELQENTMVGNYYLYKGDVLKCVDYNVLSFVQESPNNPKAHIDIIKSFYCNSEQINAPDKNADANIKLLVGKIKNYVADLTDGVRTSETDTQVAQLILDGNIIITNQ